MARVELSATTLTVNLTGWDVVWGFRRRLVVPIAHVRSARVDPHIAHAWWRDRHLDTAAAKDGPIIGTFQENDRRVFWDVHDPDMAMVIELEHEGYAALVLQVDDPQATVAAITRAVAESGADRPW